MQGRLFSIFDVPFPSYFVLLVTGVLFGAALGALWARRIGHDPDVMVDLGLTTLLAGVAGARVLHVLADGYFWDYVHLCTAPELVEWHISKAQCLASASPGALGGWLGESGGARGVWDEAAQVCRPASSDCWAWARFWAGGLTYYGGLIGATAAGWALLRADRFPFWKAADMAGMVGALGLCFGRMGCTLAGCCFGEPWDSPWALSFPGGGAASEAQARAGLLESPALPSLPVHPTQLYESAGSLALAAWLILWLHGRKRYDGHVFVAFLASYAVLRFVLEFWRADDRGGLLGLSTSQLIGLALLAGALGVHGRLRRRARSAELPT